MLVFSRLQCGAMGIMDILFSHLWWRHQKQEKVQPNKKINPHISVDDFIGLFREKKTSATNNGTKCASARMIPLAETNTCNDVACPTAGKDNSKYLKFCGTIFAGLTRRCDSRMSIGVNKFGANQLLYPSPP